MVLSYFSIQIIYANYFDEESTNSHNYRSQGQTIPYVIIVIASPPSGKLSLFNLYVALSGSFGRETIRLLGEFDDDIFFGGA